MNSLTQAPASTLRWWGLKSAPAFDFVSEFLNQEGFDGPFTWREGALVPYRKELCATIKTHVSVSTFSADNGYAAFDCKVAIHSKTIHDLGLDAGAEIIVPRAKGIFPGFVPCLNISLAHLKWCQQPSDVNPAWAMTLTRWQVGRLLREARESGIVRVEIIPRTARRIELESTLQARYGLREALVLLNTGEDEVTVNVVAQEVGRYLASLQPRPQLVGVSWGRTMSAMARWLPNGRNEGGACDFIEWRCQYP